jgi:hypothetical protein
MFDITSKWSGFKNEWHLCYYEPNHRSDDLLTIKLLSFKNGVNTDIQIWSSWALTELIKLNLNFDFVVRSLGSKELNATGNAPLDILCRTISSGLNAEYIPGLISKLKTTEKLSTISKLDDRKAQLDGVFFANNNFERILNKNILVIDDVATSGTTSRYILNAIKSKYPLINPYLFTLAKTSREDNANANISTNRFSSGVSTKSNRIWNSNDDLPF